MKIVCEYCGNFFDRKNSKIKQSKKHFCSDNCFYLAFTKKISVTCLNCSKIFLKSLSNSIRTPNHFCSRSCSATYNNTHKKYGIRRSKLEIWIESKLIVIYPNIEMHFNRKDTIGSELDIYIPSMKLAFELNGIFHYEPIYGKSKLNNTINNDLKKFKLCHDNNISLCIIDTSKQKYFKENTSNMYLKIITDIISGHGRT